MAETERVRGWWEERRPDKGQGITRQGLHFSFFFFFFFLATPPGLWDLNSLTRDRTQAHSRESAES